MRHNNTSITDKKTSKSEKLSFFNGSKQKLKPNFVVLTEEDTDKIRVKSYAYLA